MVRIKLTATGITQVQSKTAQLSAFGEDTRIPKDVVREAVRFAKSVATVKTGALRDAIHGRYGRVNTGLYIKVPDNPDRRSRPYHLWRHGLGKYGNTLRTDDAVLFKAIPFMERRVVEKYVQGLSEVLKIR